jgi:hypothetical protein
MTTVEWFSDQLRLHTDLCQSDCHDFSVYVCSIEKVDDISEYLSSLMVEVSDSRRTKIIKELLKRRGAAMVNTETTPSKPAIVWGPKSTSNQLTKKESSGTVIMSTAGRRKVDNANKKVSTNKATTKTTATLKSTKKESRNIINPFLIGENPGKFVCNCLRCGQIIWYDEPTDKKCNSKKTKDCFDLWIDAIHPETGQIDPDYALTKKQRKKNRRAREEREQREQREHTDHFMGGKNNNDNDDDDGFKEQKPSTSLVQARERVARLVQYDKNRLARSQVYDDQSDYFADSTSTWLSKEEKEEASKRDKEDRRIKQKRGRTSFVVDFAGRRIMDDEQSMKLVEEEEDRMLIDVHVDVRKGKCSSSSSSSSSSNDETNAEYNNDQAMMTSMPLSQLYGRSANVYQDLMKKLKHRAKLMERK